MRRILIVLLYFICIVVRATDYYVRTDGNDGNTGLVNNAGGAWLTVAYACAHATTAGGVINISAGTFAEGNNRMTLAVGVSMIGQGVTTIISTTYSTGGIYDINDAAILLNSPAGVSVNGNQSISYLKLDGNSLTAKRAIAVNYRSNVSIHHCTIIDFNYSAVAFEGSTNSFPTKTSTYYSTDNKVYDCTITNCSCDPPGSFGLIVPYGQQDFLVYNNILSQTSRAAGLNGTCLTSIYLKAAKIYDNTFNKNDTESTNWNFVLEMFFNEGGCEIYNNTFNGAAVLDIVDVVKNSYGFGLKIYDNDFLVAAQFGKAGQTQMAIDLEERGNIESVYVYNNHIKNFPNGIWVEGLPIDEASNAHTGDVNIKDIYIHDNLFENIGYTDFNYNYAIKISQNDALTFDMYFDNINIWNNTMISGTSPAEGYAGIGYGNGGSSTNINIKNNIIQGFATAGIWFYVQNAGTIDYLCATNNIFYGNGNSNAIYYDGITPTHNTSTSPIASDPLFVSSTDFHLQAGSPAVGAGVYMGIYGATDIEGNAWHNPPSIGAYEYDTGLPPDPKIGRSIGLKTVRTLSGKIGRVN